MIWVRVWSQAVCITSLDENYSNRGTSLVKPPFRHSRLGHALQSWVMPFPIHRLRRLRATESLRSLVRETHLRSGAVHPAAVRLPGRGRTPRNRRHARQLPDVHRRTGAGMRRSASLGIGGVILFGLPETKDEMASGAYADNGIVQRAIRAIRRETARAAGRHRRLQLRVHQPRPLRHTSRTATWITTPRCSGWRSRRSRTPAPAPISWRPRT